MSKHHKLSNQNILNARGRHYHDSSKSPPKLIHWKGKKKEKNSIVLYSTTISLRKKKFNLFHLYLLYRMKHI